MPLDPTPPRPARERLRGALLFVALVLSAPSAIGCAAEREADLLTVSEVSPSRIEPGRILRVRGQGFPPGRLARVRIDGVLHRPGDHPIEVSTELEGRAVSAERIEARFDQAALDALGGRGTLEGRVTVLFRAAEGRGAVIGRSPTLALDLSPASTERLGDELSRARIADDLLVRSGLVLGEELTDEEGLPIALVTEGSVAARTGLIAGDRLLAVAGVRAHSLADVAPPPGAEEIELRVARVGEPTPFAVRLPLGTARGGLRLETVRAAQASLGWALLVLLFLAPSAGLVDWIGRRAKRAAPAAGAVEGARARRPWRIYAKRLPWLAVATLGLASLPALDHAGWLRAPLEAILLGAVALRVSAAWTASPTDASAWRRVRDVAHGGAGMAAVAIGLGAIAALGGTTDLAALAEQQGLSPLAWTLTRTPLGPVVLGLVLAGTATAPDALAHGATRSASLARGLDDIALFAIAGVTSAIVLGGWGAASNTTDLGRLGGATLFVVVSHALFAWSRRARALSRPTRASWLALLALVVLTATGTAARIALDLPASLEPALGSVVAAAALLLACVVAARLWSGRVRSAPTAAHPFL